MRQQAWLLLQNPSSIQVNSVSTKERASELLAVAQEKLIFPNWLQLWLKKLEIFAHESSALEKARFGLAKCYCQERQRLEYLMEESET
ncbi:hypothetical protein [Merismopedia glauca]|uniref:Uncharacterized protein n=1 Tax=Merismopedia glauca CCAP 1448/3 TaxID=1296344 RepID=A0A2T1BX63_9CYAN|nr:hypothetical protein [Merismopedia glauca]PSB00581.1 hypothetical protein C7B64_22780 [Merismopedia glauca CCAP 1448/3]